MLFDKKYYSNGVERNDLVDAQKDEVVTEMQSAFDHDNDVAIFEQIHLADGRLSVSIKDRKRKIIVQYTQSKNT